MSEKNEPSRTSEEARSEDLDTNDDLSSLDRLAAFTRKILRVSKDELRIVQPSGKARTTGK